MGKRIDAIKRQEQMTPQEVMAGLLWARVVNSPDHFTKFKYYEYTAYFEFCNDNDAFRMDVYYLGQDHSFMLIQPDYNSVLGAAPSILEWLEATYLTVCPPEPPRPKRGKQRKVSNQQVAQSVLPQNTPKQPSKQTPSNGPQRRS